jgi:hypothetical protein
VRALLSRSAIRSQPIEPPCPPVVPAYEVTVEVPGRGLRAFAANGCSELDPATSALTATVLAWTVQQIW